jgi:hypothetical protein
MLDVEQVVKPGNVLEIKADIKQASGQSQWQSKSSQANSIGILIDLPMIKPILKKNQYCGLV